MTEEKTLSLNAVRAFVQVARLGSVTEASKSLNIAQSAVSRHISVLEDYLGAKLIERRGRRSNLTAFGRTYASGITEPMETILFTSNRMRHHSKRAGGRLVVRTSMPSFTYTVLVPSLWSFSAEMNNVTVDVVTAYSTPTSEDTFDVLITRTLSPSAAAERWDFYDEMLVCVGSPRTVAGRGLEAIRTTPILTITARQDILPTWLSALDLEASDIIAGARYDSNYLALPALTNGNSLMVTPHIVAADLINQGLLEVLPGSQIPSGTTYSAYAIDSSDDPIAAQAFCRWISKLCKTITSDAR